MMEKKKEQAALEKIFEIASFIKKNGVRTSKAQSAWGADRYVLGKLIFQLEDEGYTNHIWSTNLGLEIIDTCGRVEVVKGNIEDLDTLYDNIFGKE